VIIHGDAFQALQKLDSESAHCCVTSPPYWGLRDYGVEGQIGVEKTPEEYVARMVGVFREVRRVLRKDGTLWLNLGDSYAGSWGAQGRQGKAGQLAGRTACAQRQIAAAAKRKTRTGSTAHLDGIKAKDLVGIPWMMAFALRADGWYLRSEIIWHKSNPMPESVTDRPTKAHEQIFLFAKSEKYYYDADAVREPLASDTVARSMRGRSSAHKYTAGAPGSTLQTLQFDLSRCFNPRGRNRRTVWAVSTSPFKGAHFATFPPELIRPCVRAGCPPDGIVLDPFFGSGTTGLVALEEARDFIGIELNQKYVRLSEDRLAAAFPLLFVEESV
jgi:DNA modification methylase